VGVLYSDEVEELLPVGSLFLERSVAIADFDPASRSVVE
jgi:hypothetical protein